MQHRRPNYGHGTYAESSWAWSGARRNVAKQVSTVANFNDVLDPGSHSNPPLDAPQASSKRRFGALSSPIALTYEEKLVNIEGRTARFGSFAEEGLEIAR